MEPTTSRFITVKSSSIHNKGIFAAQHIPKGSYIIEYVGEKITKKESEKRYEISKEQHHKDKSNGSVYIFTLNTRYDLDGNVSWNTARYINHSCEPNCEAVDNNGSIWIVATQDIKKGEELSYDYGYDLDSWEEHPCCCGKKGCIGYIVDSSHWKKLKRELSKRGLSAKGKLLEV